MDRIKLLSNELSLIKEPLSNRDLVGCILDELDLDYDVIITFVQIMSSTPTFEGLYSMFANREKRLEVFYQPTVDRSTTALYVA
ncbi:hypothetical protein GIB67_030955 [Kingdonia uniflora]|uniref:Uncharacterized protein n=1 Tax=Kingdonia uniflora TaxID=39325 RepID=A0A7J7L3I7_9MAGN|nr:hypothetical protein GIB67_030955 [Kingdonia uniflora]